jgi:carbon-monoxide dehydrogenase small subunit
VSLIYWTSTLPCNPRPPFVIVGRRKSVLPKLLLPWGDMKKNVTITVNGVDQRAPVEPRLLLVHFLRENAGLTGTHVGCETSLCGACTVLMDGRAVKSCTVLAVQADGHKVTTVEGLANGNKLHPIQEGFWEEHGLQCGFCTPGMIMCTHDLLEQHPSPSDTEIREAISGNLCRCTGYQHIVAAVKNASRKMSKRVPARAGAR